MTVVAPGGAWHEGPPRPRALLPALGPLRPVLRPVLGPVVRPVRPVLAPVLRAALPAHLRTRPFLPPAPRPVSLDDLPPAAPGTPAAARPGARWRALLVLAAAGGAAAAAVAVSAGVRGPGSLGVEVDQRAPAAAVPVAGGVRLLDAGGVDLGTAAAAPAGVPQVITGSEPGVVAERVEGAGVAAAVAARRQLPAALAAEVTTVGATSADGVWFVLRDGARVLWGSAERGADKAAVLAALRASVPRALRYDVSAPDVPSVTPR